VALRFSCLACIAFCAILVSCDEATLMKKFTPPEDESIARRYVELLRQGKTDQIENDLDPSLLDSNTRDTFAKMAGIFPSETPESIKVVGAHTYHNQDHSTADITLEYQFPSRWLLVSVATQQKGDVSTIVGFHVTPMADSLENLNKFTLVGKSALQYLTLTCAVGSLLFTFYVFALCVRSRDIRPKWLWLIVVLVGIGKFAVNWGTNQWTYQLIAIQIPCFSMIRPFYGPWTVAAYVPLGAIVFLQRRWKMQITGESISPAAQDPERKPQVLD
jgi:hypothetical protein